MINFLEMVLLGVWATLIMDIFAITLGKLKIIRQLIAPEAVGRWTLYMFRGKFIHEDINKTPALKHEHLATWVSHYMIGIVLAGVYLLIELQLPALRNNLLMPLFFGIATVVLPWFWLYPSMGLGFLASKAPEKSPYIITSLVNHTDFGLGFLLWVILFRRFVA